MAKKTIKNVSLNPPPQDLDAEKSVLGAVLLDQKSLIKISDLLVAEDFYDERHAIVYTVMLSLSEDRSPIDILTLSSRLESNKQLKIIGGRAYIAELVSTVPTATNILRYGQIVKEKSTLRKLVKAGDEIKALGYEESKTLEENLEKAEQKVLSISQTFLKGNFVHIREVINDTFEKIADIHDRREKGEDVQRGVSSGYYDLDRILSGFQPSDLVILAARPSMGKTALALNIAENMAIAGKHVGFFSLEMSKEQLVERMFCGLMQIDSWKLKSGRLEDADFRKMGEVMDKLSKTPIFIDDAADVNMLEIRTKCRRLQAEHGVDAIIIDYLQLIRGSNTNLSTQNRVLEISEISRSLKAIARELKIPIIALSQLSRGVEMRTDKIPQLSDLRDSGSIEQDADVVMFMYRDDYYNPESSDNPGVTEIHIKKHRNGPTGKIDLGFKISQMRFVNIDKSRS